MPDLGGALGKNVLEKAPDEVGCRQADVPHLMGSVIAVSETNHAVVDGIQAAVGNCDAKHVTSEVVEDLVATAGVLGMNDPVFLPDWYRYA